MAERLRVTCVVLKCLASALQHTQEDTSTYTVAYGWYGSHLSVLEINGGTLTVISTKNILQTWLNGRAQPALVVSNVMENA